MKLAKLGPDCESRKSLQPNGGIGTHVVVTTGSALRKRFHFTLILTNATWNPDPVDDPNAAREHLFIRIKINIFGVGTILPFVGVFFSVADPVRIRIQSGLWIRNPDPGARKVEKITNSKNKLTLNL